MNDRLPKGVRFFLSYAGSAMMLIYVVLGGVLIFSDIFRERFNDTVRIGFGSILIVYGIIRGVRMFQLLKERNSQKFLIFFLAASITSSCNKINRDPYSDTPTSGKISIAVDETYQPILEDELDIFLGLYTYADIKPIYAPERNALELLFNDSVNFLIASRELTKEEIGFFNSKKLFPRQTIIAYDAIACIIHPQNKDSLLSVSQLRDIMTGKITTWSQLNKASGLGGLTVVFDNQNSSTVRYLRDSVCAGSDLSKSLTAVSQNAEVMKYVAQNNNALGIIGVNWISDQDDTLHLSFLRQVKVVALSREKEATWENSYHPYQAYIQNGQYPLKRNVYVINTEPRNGLATGFASFLAGENGQRVILKSGIVPATFPARIIQVNNSDILTE